MLEHTTARPPPTSYSPVRPQRPRELRLSGMLSRNDTLAEKRSSLGSELKSDTGEATTREITIDAILARQTESPARLQDLIAFLRSQGEKRALEAHAVEFLVSFDEYKSSFFSIPADARPPHPELAIQALSHFGHAMPHGTAQTLSSYSPNLERIRDSTCSVSSTSSPIAHVALSSPVAARSRSHSHSQNKLQMEMQKCLLDPNTQPFRAPFHTLVQRHLAPTSLASVTPLVPLDTLRCALNEAQLTTHPCTLQPVANALVQFLSSHTLSPFLANASANLSSSTSRGRALISVLLLLIGTSLLLLLLSLDSKPSRWYRLTLTPIFLIGFGYAIAAYTNTCCTLAVLGLRELKPHERQELLQQHQSMQDGGAQKSGNLSLKPYNSIGSYSSSSSTSSSSSKTRLLAFVPKRWWSNDSATLTFDMEKGPRPLHLADAHNLYRSQSNDSVGSDSSRRPCKLRKAQRTSTDSDRGSFVLPLSMPLSSSPSSRPAIANYGTTTTSETARPSAFTRSSSYTYKPPSWRDRVKNYLGSPTITVPVEDGAVRVRQRRRALWVGVGLAMGTAAVMAIFVAIP